MAQVNTVLGPVDVSELGFTSMHEHFIYGFPGHQTDISVDCFKEERDLPVLIEEAKLFKSLGYKTLVDCTVSDCGRDHRILKKIAEAAGINIICVSGWYAEMYAAPAYWIGRASMGADIDQEIYEMFVTEATKGIGFTEIKAGLLKVSSSLNRITEYERHFFGAAARASKDTGRPVTTHADGSTMGLEQARTLIEFGAAPERVLIGHMCGCTDTEYLKRVLATGVNIGFDRFGIEGFDFMMTPTDAERVETLTALLKDGYADQIMLGHDTVKIDLGRPFKLSPAAQKFKDHTTPRVVTEYALPELRARGVPEADIEKLTVKNPARFLA
jgi:phosphotriesterase-related protein